MKKIFLVSLVIMSILLIGCSKRQDSVNLEENEEENRQTSDNDETKKDSTLIKKDSYYLGDSTYSVVLSEETDGTANWSFIYKTTDENEAATAYSEICIVGKTLIKELNKTNEKQSKIASIGVYLSDGRYIIGTSITPTMATNSDGSVITLELPDWYWNADIDHDGEVAKFIQNKTLDDFMLH